MKRINIPYPWISILGALLLITWQLVLAKPQWFPLVKIPEAMSQPGILLTAVSVWLALLAFEVYRFFHACGRYRKEMKNHEEQLTELFESRRELGTRARTYSSHAEKLKLFISDKLLEYIEYDEKFLHFKNIASEVRHNGVISYDRAQTALRQAAEICANQLEDAEQQQQFEAASDSLLYLWDLLDIATTDNISLHVANRIYDSEEYYFQSQLNKTDTPELPYKPTFSMFSALRRTLKPMVEDPADFNQVKFDIFPINYVDRRFHLLATGDCEMLGNHNHMVLLLENLLNNALFYADKKPSKALSNRVAILQTLQPEQVVLEVYNRGPKIKEQDRERIFQLGYSSRRIRDHHGKGLGLYFVNEICKGFEGVIDFDNIENQDSNLSLRVELSNGDVETHFISQVEENGKALCQLPNTGSKATRSQDWSFSSRITSIEVSSQSSAEIQHISLTDKDILNYEDQMDPLLPRWSLDIQNRPRSAKFIFRPIDVRGVRFRVRLPTAMARLEDQEGIIPKP